VCVLYLADSFESTCYSLPPYNNNKTRYRYQREYVCLYRELYRQGFPVFCRQVTSGSKTKNETKEKRN
jgi:hypothetical protein